MNPAPPPFYKKDPWKAQKTAFVISLVLHGILIAALWVDILIPSKKHKRIPPTLRVDIVGLPDKNPSLPKTAQLEAPKEEKKELLKSQTKENPPVEPAKPDEMVIKDSSASRKANLKKISKRNQSALARIKALKKIQDSTSQSNDTPIKGNILSKGTSLSGEAREAAEAHYYEIVQARLESNWALPAWLARADYSAQVRIFIDAQGNVKKTQFIRSSGNPQFDEAVRRCIQESEPLPSPPIDLRMSVWLNGIVVGFPL
jgi:colicin import membrane protein